MRLNFDDSVKINQCAKYVGQRSFISKVKSSIVICYNINKLTYVLNDQNIPTPTHDGQVACLHTPFVSELCNYEQVSAWTRKTDRHLLKLCIL